MKEKSETMGFEDFLQWINEKLMPLKDAAIGSFLYFLYGIVYDKRNLWQGLTSFFTGLTFAAYFTDPAFYTLSSFGIKFLALDKEVVAFIVGLLGMRFVEALFAVDFKALITRITGVKFSKQLSPESKDSKIDNE